MLWLIIAVLIIIADQAVKYLVVSGMNVGDTAFSILNLFDITYIQNKGAAFSLLSGKLSLLSIISVAFCICAVIYWIKKKPTHPLLCRPSGPQILVFVYRWLTPPAEDVPGFQP